MVPDGQKVLSDRRTHTGETSKLYSSEDNKISMQRFKEILQSNDMAQLYWSDFEE